MARRQTTGKSKSVPDPVARRLSPVACRLPPPLGWLRTAGLVVAWVGAILCGWQAGGSRWGSGSPGARGDLLGVVLRGAGAWVGLTVIWLAGIGICQRIIQNQGSGVRGQGSAKEIGLTPDP